MFYMHSADEEFITATFASRCVLQFVVRQNNISLDVSWYRDVFIGYDSDYLHTVIISNVFKLHSLLNSRFILSFVLTAVISSFSLTLHYDKISKQRRTRFSLAHIYNNNMFIWTTMDSEYKN